MVEFNSEHDNILDRYAKDFLKQASLLKDDSLKTLIECAQERLQFKLEKYKRSFEGQELKISSSFILSSHKTRSSIFAKENEEKFITKSTFCGQMLKY